MLLKKGASGKDVRKLQEKLGITADGVFGSGTELAVKAWQTQNGLTADGVVGPMTWGKLFEVGVYGELAEGDLDDDDNDGDDDSEGNVEAESDGDFGEIAGLKIDQLNAHVPSFVIAQIPQCASQFDINTRLRLAHFLAQCGHESGGFKFTIENLNYSEEGLKKTFKKYFPADVAKSHARQPEKIASRVYAGRMGNGDEASKDGWKYRGRGYIQLTGKSNYAAFDASVEDDILAEPELVEKKYPLLSAAWFWNSRSLNDLADQGSSDATVEAITRKVNGGTNGLADRIKHFKQYYALLG
jgi:putative chitinase